MFYNIRPWTQCSKTFFCAIFTIASLTDANISAIDANVSVFNANNGILMPTLVKYWQF